MNKLVLILIAILTVNLQHSAIAQTTSYWQQNVDYEINVTLDDVNHALDGSIAMRYTNNSPDELAFIWIHLWPNAYKNTKTAFARQKFEQGSQTFQFAKEEDRGYIDSLNFKVGGEDVKLEYDPKNPDIARLILNKSVKSGETINIKTTFYVKIPKCFSRMGHTGQQYQISQWYPKPAVYDAQGWHPIPYLDQGEFYSEFGNFHVFITVPENYVVGASGDLQTKSEIDFLDKVARETENNKFDNTDLSFPPSSEKTKTIEYQLKNSHDFAWFADKRFNVMKSGIVLPESERTVITYAYFNDEHAEEWKKACEYINRSVLFYSENVGEYPWNVAQAVDGSLEVEGAGGMEYPTITVVSGDMDAESLDNVITHEVGHNWFYGIIGSNERVNGWMDEGINTYYEDRYMDTYYGERNALGVPPVLANLIGVDTSSDDNIIWNINQVCIKQNKSQALNTYSTEFTPINYGLVMYMETAYFFRYLTDVLGKDEFDRIMHIYYDTYEFKHVYPGDMQKLFEAETGENYAWFFEKLINEDRGPDYKIGKFQKGKTAMAVDITNKSDIPAPFSLSLMDGENVLRTDWFRGFTGSQTIYVNYKSEWNVTHIKIDAQQTIPETERENNTIKTSGLFKTIEPLQLKFAGFGVDDPTRTTINYLPIFGTNENDGFMLGLGVWNMILPTPMIDFVLAPMYSFNAETLVGQGSVGLNIYPDNGFIDRLRISETVMSYSYDDFTVTTPNDSKDFIPQFRKFETKVEVDLAKREFKSKLNNTIQFRNLYIMEEDKYFFVDDAGLINTTGFSTFFVQELSYHLTNKITRIPHSLNIVGEMNDDAFKFYADFNITYTYPKKKYGVDLRLFAGLMNIFSVDGDYAKDVFTLSGNNGFYDDLYDEIYFARNSSDGIKSQQISMTDGFFKTPGLTGDIATTNDKLFAANIEVPLPFNIPVALFADLGTLGSIDPDISGKLLYDAGVMIRLPNNIFEVYFPLLWSEDIKTQIEGAPYSEKISFMLNLNTANLFELMRKLKI